MALAEHGVDTNGGVIGSPGKRPVLRNVSIPEVQTFREQVQMIDMLGCEIADEIGAKIEELSQQAAVPCGCSECGGRSPVTVSTIAKMIANEPSEVVTMDKAGYFVIVPLADKGVINVEILVTGFLGGNSNGTTRDFSLGVRGFRIRGGRVAEPVGEMNVSGNHLELWQGLAAVGDDPYPYAATRTPTLVFEGVQFAGT